MIFGLIIELYVWRSIQINWIIRKKHIKLVQYKKINNKSKHLWS